MWQIRQMDNVETFLASEVTADDILEYSSEHVVLATGSKWRRDGVSRYHLFPQTFPENLIFTPDDIYEDNVPSGHVVLYDDDHFYLGGVLAEHCKKKGCEVTLVTPAAVVSSWTVHTLEQEIIQENLLNTGIKIMPHHFVRPGKKKFPEVVHIYTGESTVLTCDALVLVTARIPNASLDSELEKVRNSWDEAGIKSVTRIGDANAPSTIAAAVYSGHRYARELDEELDPDIVPFNRELTQIDPEPDWKTFWE